MKMGRRLMDLILISKYLTQWYLYSEGTNRNCESLLTVETLNKGGPNEFDRLIMLKLDSYVYNWCQNKRVHSWKKGYKGESKTKIQNC